MHFLDRATRAFWHAVGHRIDLSGEHAWLAAPTQAHHPLADGGLDRMGIDSRVTVLRDHAGTQVPAAWLRTLRATGDYVFSGCYSVHPARRRRGVRRRQR